MELASSYGVVYEYFKPYQSLSIIVVEMTVSESPAVNLYPLPSAEPPSPRGILPYFSLPYVPFIHLSCHTPNQESCRKRKQYEYSSTKVHRHTEIQRTLYIEERGQLSWMQVILTSNPRLLVIYISLLAARLSWITRMHVFFSFFLLSSVHRIDRLQISSITTSKELQLR